MSVVEIEFGDWGNGKFAQSNHPSKQDSGGQIVTTADDLRNVNEGVN
jgi:hypothetical protein